MRVGSLTLTQFQFRYGNENSYHEPAAVVCGERQNVR